jgi:hypothetical protein
MQLLKTETTRHGYVGMAHIPCHSPKGFGMVGWTNFGITRVFFSSGCDCKCYIMGLINRDSFLNNTLKNIYMVQFFVMQKS